jgi:hypothetical protein
VPRLRTTIIWFRKQEIWQWLKYVRQTLWQWKSYTNIKSVSTLLFLVPHINWIWWSMKQPDALPKQ